MNLLRSYEKRALKVRSFLFDRDNLSLDEATVAKRTQRNPALSLQQDRLEEFAEFYQISPEEAQAVESIHNKDALEDMFNAVETDAGLTKNYQDASLLYTARMQLAYTRFPAAAKLLHYINSLYVPWRRQSVRILDYGCGPCPHYESLSQTHKPHQIPLLPIFSNIAH